ncbi:MAG: hypothetical protein ACRCT6_02070, partial [Notoacmeibacter sp.]
VETQVESSSSASPFKGDNGKGKKSDNDSARSRVEENIAEFDKPAAPPKSEGAPAKSVADFTDPTPGDGQTDLPVLEAEIKLFGQAGITQSQREDGTQLISGSFAITEAETSDDFVVQQTTETINGTGGNDVIFADNSTAAPAGTTVRVINFVAEMPSSTTTVKQVYVTGLPEGYSVLNAVEKDGGFVVRLNPEETADIRVVLQYKLPEEGAETDFHGFYSNFVFNMEYTLDDGDGNLSSALGVARFAIRDVEDVTDTEFEDPITGEKYYILNANPPGNSVTAGSGDDTIVAAAGDDVLDGGAGNDTVSYEMSSNGVIADLVNAATANGYAENDIMSGIENLIGSDYN